MFIYCTSPFTGCVKQQNHGTRFSMWLLKHLVPMTWVPRRLHMIEHYGTADEVRAVKDYLGTKFKIKAGYFIHRNSVGSIRKQPE